MREVGNETFSAREKHTYTHTHTSRRCSFFGRPSKTGYLPTRGHFGIHLWVKTLQPVIKTGAWVFIRPKMDICDRSGSGRRGADPVLRRERPDLPLRAGAAGLGWSRRETKPNQTNQPTRRAAGQAARQSQTEPGSQKENKTTQPKWDLFGFDPYPLDLALGRHDPTGPQHWTVRPPNRRVFLRVSLWVSPKKRAFPRVCHFLHVFFCFPGFPRGFPHKNGVSSSFPVGFPPNTGFFPGLPIISPKNGFFFGFPQKLFFFCFFPGFPVGFPQTTGFSLGFSRGFPRKKTVFAPGCPVGFPVGFPSEPARHRCPFWLVCLKYRGPWFTWWFHHLPGPSIFQNRAPHFFRAFRTTNGLFHLPDARLSLTAGVGFFRRRGDAADRQRGGLAERRQAGRCSLSGFHGRLGARSYFFLFLFCGFRV